MVISTIKTLSSISLEIMNTASFGCLSQAPCVRDMYHTLANVPHVYYMCDTHAIHCRVLGVLHM